MFNKIRAKERTQLLEQVGADLRDIMGFIDPVRITPDGTPLKPAKVPADKTNTAASAD